MKRLLTLPLLSLVLGAIFLFAPAPHAAHADGGGCAQNNNVTYSDGSGYTYGQLDLWPCISSDSNAVYSSGYASFRNIANSIYQNDSGNWYQWSGCSLTIGLLPSGGTLDTGNNTPLQQTVSCNQWVNNKSIGVALPTFSSTKNALTLTGSYQTAAQVTLTYTDDSGDTLTESSPAGYSPATQINWSQTCTQSNNLSYHGYDGNTSGGSLDLWPCIGVSGSTLSLNTNASFRYTPLSPTWNPQPANGTGYYTFLTCSATVKLTDADQQTRWSQTTDCTNFVKSNTVGASLAFKQYNYRQAGLTGYYQMDAQVTLQYYDSANGSSNNDKYVTSSTVTRMAYYL